MLSVRGQMFNEKMNKEAQKLALYRLIGEGYKAMEGGAESTLEEVLERLEKRRIKRKENELMRDLFGKLDEAIDDMERGRVETIDGAWKVIDNI